MALHAGPLNNTKPSSIGAGLYNLIATLVAAGWIIKASGDGLAAYSSTTTVFSGGSASGANGWDNVGAWARLRYPANINGTPREICIVRGSTASGYACIAISPANGFVVGGNATTAATATDQQMIIGSNLTPANNGQVINGVDGQVYMNAIADDAAPYNFWLGCFTQGNGSSTGGFASDFITSLSTGAGGTDPDGYIYFSSASMWTNSAFSGWHGFVSGSWVINKSICSSFNTSGGGSVGNVYEQGHDLVPSLIIANGDASHDFVRGYATHLLFDFHNGTVSSHSAQNYQGGTGNRILMDVFSVPWDGSAIITT